MSREWQPVRLSQIGDPQLIGRTMRVQSRVIDGDRRQRFAVMVQGVYVGPGRGTSGALYVAVTPDPDLSLVDDKQQPIIAEILARRAADEAAGEDPGKEWWGPLTIRNVLHVHAG